MFKARSATYDGGGASTGHAWGSQQRAPLLIILRNTISVYVWRHCKHHYLSDEDDDDDDETSAMLSVFCQTSTSFQLAAGFSGIA